MDALGNDRGRMIVADRIGVDAARGRGAILFDRERLPQANPDWLDPAWWGVRAERVGAGGRGAAWYVEDGFGRAVLRQYRRGGLIAHLSRDRYLWTGEARCRSFREFRLLVLLSMQGLPVPAPLAACYRRQGLAYRAAILVERLPATGSLADHAVGGDVAVWERVGQMLAGMHRAGVDHADLNATNILLGQDQAWLIDFDRCGVRPPAVAWRRANLARLRRSLSKIAPDGGWEDGFGRLEGAYATAYGEDGR